MNKNQIKRKYVYNIYIYVLINISVYIYKYLNAINSNFKKRGDIYINSEYVFYIIYIFYKKSLKF